MAKNKVDADYRRPEKKDPRSIYFQYYGVSSEEFAIYFKMFFSDIRPSPQQARVLDIGCNIGNFLVLCSKESVGVDIDEWAMNVAKKRGLKVVNHNANEKLPFPNESFDAINCRQNLEHLERPGDVLKEMHRVLRPGGKLVITVQNLEHYKWTWFNNPFHVSPFTKMSLGRLTFLAGFRKYDIYDFMNGLFGMRRLYNMGVSARTIKTLMKAAAKVRPVIHILEAYK